LQVFGDQRAQFNAGVLISHLGVIPPCANVT
jgi:hypothetical protein